MGAAAAGVQVNGYDAAGKFLQQVGGTRLSRHNRLRGSNRLKSLEGPDQ